MRGSLQVGRPQLSQCLLAVTLCASLGAELRASDHLDTPTVIANPQADIGDIYAWTSPSGRRLNLVMDIVGHGFSSKLLYTIYIDSGRRFGKTTATTSIVCRFPKTDEADCVAGSADHAHGDASNPDGLLGDNHRMRVFAGMRDDPFFNNVKGTRAAYERAFGVLARGATVNAAGCPKFDVATSREVLDQWRHTDGGPPTNFLARWTTSAIVISIDLDVVTQGGPLLAVWAVTATTDRQLDRVGRPLTKNALLGLNAPDDIVYDLRERWNETIPSKSAQFIPEIEKSLPLYDSFDSVCGNQLLADNKVDASKRYRSLATLLADDRLWVNSASSECSEFFAVELAAVAGQTAVRKDCGGRTPNYNAANIWRSLMVKGSTTGIDDGLTHDEHEPSASTFPFLAPPDPDAINHYAHAPNEADGSYKE